MKSKNDREQGRSLPNKRGLATLSMEQRKEIAKMGGIAAHRKGTAHEFTRREAKIAGKKGGSLKKKIVKK